MNSLHRLLNCEIGGLDCRVLTYLAEKKTRKSVHMTVLDFLVCAQGCKISDMPFFSPVNKHAFPRWTGWTNQSSTPSHIRFYYYYSRLQNTCPLYTHVTLILQCVVPCYLSEVSGQCSYTITYVLDLLFCLGKIEQYHFVSLSCEFSSTVSYLGWSSILCSHLLLSLPNSFRNSTGLGFQGLGWVN